MTSVSVNDVCGPEAVAIACEPFSFTAALCQCRDAGLGYNEATLTCEGEFDEDYTLHALILCYLPNQITHSVI